ncbi:syntaxin-17-like [Varroa destructor]|uniref:t-SNARE coiled-coil homology domain-containing protein n=1 Tax=Varroa destructor TaxID=109461 RepID=A0A7M7JB42_VARDE|nr:syntaxin-17-like [Varroa destructor]
MNSYEEPERWQASRKLSFKQISVGLNQIVNDGVPKHLNDMRDALRQASQLSTATSTWASGIIWDEEALLCRSLVQQSLSTLMQDLRSLEKMRSSITDEDIQRLEDLAIPCCRRICSAIEEAKAVIAALEKHQTNTTVCQSNKILPSSSSEFEDFNKREYKQNLKEEQLLLETEIDRERLSDVQAIEKDINYLRDMIDCMQQQIVTDEEKIKQIDAQVENATLEVSTGEKMLRQARHFKTAALPATCAVAGLIAGGPIGAVAGVRIGIAVSLIGTAVGYISGKFLHNTNKFAFPMFKSKAAVLPTEQEFTPKPVLETAAHLTSNKKGA